MSINPTPQNISYFKNFALNIHMNALQENVFELDLAERASIRELEWQDLE
ncbi:15303_t:CDS:2, partial [Gigaspora rosea]